MSDEFNGFDSESDRRDAIRRQIVDECVAYVQQSIGIHGPTQTHEERRYLEIVVARRLLKGQELESMSAMLTQETLDALNKLEKR